jgi:hypothetical protein
VSEILVSKDLPEAGKSAATALLRHIIKLPKISALS